MIYLFIHQNFPAQYRHVVRYLADQPNNQVYFITQPNDNWMQGVNKVVYKPPEMAGNHCHPYTIEFDNAVRTGMAVVEACQTLVNHGVTPDLICGHNGWGEMLFVKDVFPDVPTLSYFEFYYHMHNVDVGFDPEYPTAHQNPFRLRTRNAVSLLSHDAVDWGHTPTRWQRSVHPPEMRARISVLHEGVDTDIVTPSDETWLTFNRDGITLRKTDEVITYVARNLEPYRGFHIFMRAASEILRRRPNAHIVIVGGDGVSYGTSAPEGLTFRQLMLRELAGRLDLSRIHFVGQLPYESYLDVLRLSSAHIYLTYPFVLSWSFIEAMACGCAVIGSNTPPVMEVLKDGENGLAVDFFSPTEIADAVDAIFQDPTRMAPMRAAARTTAVRDFDLKTRALPRWLELFDAMVNWKKPSLFDVEPESATAG